MATERLQLVGSMGAKSWNDLQDRPFYEETENIGDTLTWDGTPTDIYTLGPGGEAGYYKVSDDMPTAEELVGGVYVCSDGEQSAVTNDWLTSFANGSVLYGGQFVVVYEDNATVDEVGLVFLKKGIYFAYVYEDGYHVTSLQVPNYNFTKTTTHKIDKKYLPETIITANSKDELPDPATVPEDTIALVPSEGESGGGLPYIELTTVLTIDADNAELTAEETAMVIAALECKCAVVSFNVTGIDGMSLSCLCSKAVEGGVSLFHGVIDSYAIMVTAVEGVGYARIDSAE